MCSMTGEMLFMVTYGLRVQADNDPYIKDSAEAVYITSTTISDLGSNLVDLFPILKYVPEWMPGAGFHSMAKKGREVAHRILELPFKAAKDRIVRENPLKLPEKY